MSDEDRIQRLDAAADAFLANEDARAARTASVIASAQRKQAPAGWYPDPKMVDTRRYWDGEKWTDLRAPAAAPSRNNPGTVKRIAWAISLIFLIPVAMLTFSGPTVAGESCGSWISPKFTDVEVSMREADLAISGGSLMDRAQLHAVARECNDTINTHQLIAFILLGLAVGSRVAIPLVARALRD